VGGNHGRVFAAGDVPHVALAGRRVQLFALVDRAVAQADVADVVDVAVGLFGRMRTADDVDVVVHRQAREQLLDLGRVFAELADGVEGRQLVVFGRQQLQRDQLGEGDEVGVVVGGDVGEILDLRGEIVERG